MVCVLSRCSAALKPPVHSRSLCTIYFPLQLSQEVIDIFEGVQPEQALRMATNLGFTGPLQTQVTAATAALKSEETSASKCRIIHQQLCFIICPHSLAGWGHRTVACWHQHYLIEQAGYSRWATTDFLIKFFSNHHLKSKLLSADQRERCNIFN